MAQGELAMACAVFERSHRLEGLQILRDANLVDLGEWNRPLPIDGGTYNITARAPRCAAWSTKGIVKPEGDERQGALPRLDLTTPPKPKARPPAAPAPALPALASPGERGPGAFPAGPAPTPAPPPAPQGEPLRPGLARALSIGGTLASAGILIGARYLYDAEPTAAVAIAVGGGLGLLIAPSAGHWYAGKYFPRGMWMRLAGTTVAGVAAILITSPTADLGDLPKAAFLFTGGSLLFLVGAVDDLYSAPGYVSQHNQTRGFAISPIVAPSAGGLALGGRF